MDKTLMNLALDAFAKNDDFRIDRFLRYNSFVPQLYNFCRSIGMEKGKIMPSRAFCSDESQGFPIILIAKHFGTFPFNHGRTGGVVATERNGPHADHGKDLVLIQASHVGYDPKTEIFGRYRRMQTDDCRETSNCGKIHHIVHDYTDAFEFAQNNIVLGQCGKDCLVTIDNQLIDIDRSEGLFLDLDFMLARHSNGSFKLVKSHSTSKSYQASDAFKKFMLERQWPNEGRAKIGNSLPPELFRFTRNLPGGIETQLERNLLPVMPNIVSSASPMLAAAQANTQAEFDRAYRAIKREPGYRDKTLVFISGINIDISPRPNYKYPMTLFVPWAAYVQPLNADAYTLEQEQLIDQLLAQSSNNPDEIDLENVIQKMGSSKELEIERSGTTV